MSRRHVNRYQEQADQAREARIRLLACESKRRWPARAQAEDAMPRTQEAYACDLCGGWHRRSLGRTPGLPRRTRRGAC